MRPPVEHVSGHIPRRSDVAESVRSSEAGPKHQRQAARRSPLTRNVERPIHVVTPGMGDTVRTVRGRLIGALLVAGLVFGAAAAVATSVSVSRCGYIALKWQGRAAVYPWHISCRAAKKVLADRGRPNVKAIMFTAPGTDAGTHAYRIDGKWWVCGGLMGNYFCEYPYRPARVGGGTTYKGPFTKAIWYEVCADGAYLCRARDTIAF